MRIAVGIKFVYLTGIFAPWFRFKNVILNVDHIKVEILNKLDKLLFQSMRTKGKLVLYIEKDQ